MIEAVIERCAGIDVGKKFLVVCVTSGPLEAEPKIEVRKFGTIVAELERLRDWLIQEGCSHAVMESTGSYWKPVFNILEGSVEVVLAKPMMSKTGVATRRIPMTAAGLPTCFATA
jgi:hypothetical protein